VRDLFQGISQERGFADPAPPVKNDQSGSAAQCAPDGFKFSLTTYEHRFNVI
jgi:hypothetical protein